MRVVECCVSTRDPLECDWFNVIVQLTWRVRWRKQYIALVPVLILSFSPNSPLCFSIALLEWLILHIVYTQLQIKKLNICQLH